MAVRTTSELWSRARRFIPGGVNSPVRAMRAVGLDEPLFVRRAAGAELEAADGSRYLDWVMSWGPLLFGHADPEAVEAVRDAALRGTSFGAATEAEVELAAEIADAVPSVEKVRLVSSGTEAAISALRLARAFTKKGSPSPTARIARTGELTPPGMNFWARCQSSERTRARERAPSPSR